MPGKTNFTCYGEDTLWNSKKVKTATISVKGNKNKNSEQRTKNAIGNAMCRSYSAVTKNGLNEK